MWGFAGLMPLPGWERVVGTREGVLATASQEPDLGPSGEVCGVSFLPPGPGGAWGGRRLWCPFLSGLTLGNIWGPWSETCFFPFLFVSWRPPSVLRQKLQVPRVVRT